MSLFSPTPVYMVIITTLVTMMPGRKNCRYARGLSASAPPNRYVNISTMMIGNAVTSNSCSGTCLIFSRARQPNVSDAASGLGRAGRSRRGEHRGERLGGRDVDGRRRARW